LIAAVVLPVVVLESTRGLEALASLYAIGVTGAICLNLGSCSLDRTLPMKGWQRIIMGGPAVLMAGIWVTIAVTKPHALLFAVVLCGVGLLLREGYRTKAVVVREREGAIPMAERAKEGLRKEPDGVVEEFAEDGGRILVAAHGMTASAKYAFEEAKLRGARLYFLFVREVQVAAEVVGRLGDNAEAQRVMAEVKAMAAAETLQTRALEAVSKATTTPWLSVRDAPAFNDTPKVPSVASPPSVSTSVTSTCTVFASALTTVTLCPPPIFSEAPI
jgi:hypothetical protein